MTLGTPDEHTCDPWPSVMAPCLLAGASPAVEDDYDILVQQIVSITRNRPTGRALTLATTKYIFPGREAGKKQGHGNRLRLMASDYEEVKGFLFKTPVDVSALVSMPSRLRRGVGLAGSGALSQVSALMSLGAGPAGLGKAQPSAWP